MLDELLQSCGELEIKRDVRIGFFATCSSMGGPRHDWALAVRDRHERHHSAQYQAFWVPSFRPVEAPHLCHPRLTGEDR